MFGVRLRLVGALIVSCSAFACLGLAGAAHAEESFTVSLSSNHSEVQVPNSYTLTATTNQDVGPTEYEIRIIENNTGFTIKHCANGTECIATVETSWERNNEPYTQTFHAVVSSSTHIAAESSQQVAAISPYRFAVGISWSKVGESEYSVKATTNRNVGPTPYTLDIRDKGYGRVASCYTGTECSTFTSGEPPFIGLVQGSEGIYGISNSESLELTEVAVLFSSPEKVCEALLFYPGTHLDESSLSDQYKACQLAAATAGATVASVVAASNIHTSGKESVLWYLLHAGTATDPEIEKPSPTEVEPDPMPDPLPDPWPVPEVLYEVQKNNPTAKATTTTTAFEQITERCMWQISKLAKDPVEECISLPIFALGSNIKTATEHAITALYGEHGEPKWLILNYESKETKEAKGESREWYRGKSGCEGETPAEKSCDEYPFFTTLQGGPNGDPLPSLAFINAADNSKQGGYYGHFLKFCKIAEKGAFISLPLPPSLGITTKTRLCNGGF
jgi:hypothetical protein